MEKYILNLKPTNNKQFDSTSYSGKKVETSKLYVIKKDQSTLDLESLQKVINKLSKEIINLKKGKLEQPSDRGNFKWPFKMQPSHKPPPLNECLNTEGLENILQVLIPDLDITPNNSEEKEAELDFENQEKTQPPYFSLNVFE